MENQQKAYPNILQAIGITALIVIFLNGITLLFSVIFRDFLPRTAIFLLGYTSAMCITIWIAKSFRKEKGQASIALFQKMNIKAALLIAIATFALDAGIASPITDFIPISEEMKKNLLSNFGNMDVFMFVAVVFGAPFFEEYLFRGLMLDGLLNNYQPVLAITICSVLFGIMHINPLQLVSATIGGFFLGWVYYKSKNLSYCMLIHFVINLTGFISLQQIGAAQIFENGIIGIYGGMRNAILIFIVSMLILAASIWLLNQIFNQEKSFYEDQKGVKKSV